MSRRRKAAKLSAAGVVLAVVLGVLAILFLARSPVGQRLVLEELLRRLRDSVDGTITVEDIRSGSLFSGATLYGVHIVDPEGRPFFHADSVTATYAWRSFLSGDVVLSSLEVWTPVVQMVRYPGEDRFNVDVIFRTDEDRGSDDPETARTVFFEDVVLHGALMEILYPVAEGEDPAPRAVTRPAPGGGLLQRIAFEDVDAVLPRAHLMGPDLEGPTVEVEDLDLVARIYRDPLVVEALRGVVTWADSRLAVAARELVLPGTEASGSIYADFGSDEGLELGFDLESERLSLDDVQWAEPRIPSGTASGHFQGTLLSGDLQLTLGDVTARLVGGDRIVADGSVRLGQGGVRRIDDLDLRLAGFDLDRMTPWLDGPLPIEGLVAGPLRLDGTMGALSARGDLTWDEPGSGRRPTTADFSGVFDLSGDRIAFRDLDATLDPLDFALFRDLSPDFDVAGSGRAVIRASGTVGGAVTFRADVVHRTGDLPTSRILAEGSLRPSGGTYFVDVDAEVSPLSLSTIQSFNSAFPASGVVNGTIRANGLLTDLEVVTDLETEAGRLALESRFDLRDPGAYYRVQGSLADFRLSRLVPRLPERTVFTGDVFLEGRGLDPATASIDVRLLARGSRVGGLDVDTATVALRIRDGVFQVDTLTGLVSGVSVEASGSLAASEGGPAGELRVTFASDSLQHLQPFFFGDSLIIQETLSDLERQVLELDGIDPDTLPRRADVAVGGAVRGEVSLRGSLQEFDAEGSATFESIEYTRFFARGAEVTFSGRGLPDQAAALSLDVVADSLAVANRRFAGAEIELEYQRPRGRARILLERDQQEDYRANATFELDSLGGAVELEELSLRFDSLRWDLAAPSRLAWDGTTLRVEDLVVERPGDDPLRVRADGVIPVEGSADFELDVEGLQLGRVARILQMDTSLAGRVDLRLRVTGTADRPAVDGELVATDLHYDTYELTRVAGEVGYGRGALRFDLDAWDGDLQVLTTDGTVPADLSLIPFGLTLRDEPVDMRASADSLPAALVVGFLRDLENVEGTVAGDFEVGGTVQSPEPSGSLTLQDASWTVASVGVRYEDIQGVLTLREDGVVEVDAGVRAEGTGRVTGTVTLDPLSDPGLDLQIALDGFQAVERRDVEGRVSGTLDLVGTYQRPRVEGDLRVVEGTLFLEEFQRSAEIVDLSDPRFFRIVDTTDVVGRPILAGSENPFLRNLLVQVDLSVERDTWLRSEDMDVEIGGDLIVTYDRRSRDLVLLGTLQAIRGSYSVFGRRFEVDQGEVEFVGTPGINPNLDIQATARVRRGTNSEPLDITASVQGTLQDPRVTLSSGEEATAQSDLVSYLIFGRPSYELTSGQAQVIEGAAGSLVGAAYGAGLTFLSGSLTNRLSSLLAAETPFDYLAITQPAALGSGGVGATLAQTQIEVGQYLDEDLFWIFVFQPAGLAQGSDALNGFGIRLEWTPTDDYTVEGFIEDRFLRTGYGFRELGFETSKVVGFFVFREWGY